MIVGERVDRNLTVWQTGFVPRPLPPSSAAPFEVPPRGANGAIRANALCIHGYTGTPFEVLPLAHALADVGVCSRGIVLPGHEGDASVLDHTTWQDWDRAGDVAFAALPTNVPRIVVGSSMGGLISLRIAARHNVDVLILMCPALRFFADGVATAFASQRGLWKLKRSVRKEDGASDVADPEGRRMNPSYPVLPLRGIGELGLLQGVVEKDLAKVRAPLCIFHGAQDHTIPPIASEIVARGVSSPRVEHHVLRNSFHVVGIDVDRDELCDLAVSFVSEVLQ